MPIILIAESVDTEVLNQQQAIVKTNLEACDPQSEALQFVYQPDISVAELEEVTAPYHGLIVRPKQVTAKAIAAAKELKLIIRGGAGVNTIDLTQAKSQNIVVENTPGKNSVATAEFAFHSWMRLLTKRHIDASVAALKAGEDPIPEDFMGYELAGKTLGIIGLGNIGRLVAQMALGFQMNVIAYTRSQKDLPIKQFHDFNAFLDAGCDVLTLHVPLTDETEHLINQPAIERLRDQTILINTARPQLIDPKALELGLKKGKISHFAIDGDTPLVKEFVALDKDNKGLVTHHIADATYEAQRKITEQLLLQVEAFFLRGDAMNRVV